MTTEEIKKYEDNLKKQKIELFAPPVCTFTTVREAVCDFKAAKCGKRSSLLIEVLYDNETKQEVINTFKKEFEAAIYAVTIPKDVDFNLRIYKGEGHSIGELKPDFFFDENY